MKSKYVLILILLPFIVRTIYVITLPNKLIWPDEQAFQQIAIGIVEGKGYVSIPTRANPILPYFLAAVYSIFGVDIIIARIFHAFFGALSCAFVFLVGKKIFNNRVGWIAFFVLTFYPLHIYLSGIFVVANFL